MLRMRVIWTHRQGAPYVTTLNWRDGTGADTQAGAQFAVDRWDAFMVAAAGVIENEVTAVPDTTVESVDPLTNEITGNFVVTVATRPGSSATAALPFATQYLLNTFTGVFVAGREIRGRIFIPGPSVGAMGTGTGSGRPSSTTVTTLASASAQLLTGTTADLGVYSLPRVGPPPVAGAFTAVSAIAVKNDYAVLRSRRD